jgi:hypothetical protein
MLRLLSCNLRGFANLRSCPAIDSCDALRALRSVSQLSTKNSHLASMKLLLLGIRESYSQRWNAYAA